MNGGGGHHTLYIRPLVGRTTYSRIKDGLSDPQGVVGNGWASFTPVVRGYRPSDVGATTNLTSSGGHYRPCLCTEQISIVASDLSDLYDLSDLSEKGTRPRHKKSTPIGVLLLFSI